MLMIFKINDRTVLKSDCEYSADCPVVQYVKREQFLCNMRQDSQTNETIVNMTVFNTDAVAENLWKIHNTHKNILNTQKQQIMVQGK